jgi:mono/diheme cytochrome c family protein
MEDGAVVKGAQGNFPFDRAMAYDVRAGGPPAIEANRKLARLLWLTPGLTPEFFANFDHKSPEEIARALETHPGGVLTRHRSGPWAPIQVPDLIGVAARKYLDHTGLQKNRGTEDLMRYAALNQGADNLSSFGGFVPSSEFVGSTLDPNNSRRYSDEQLYALVQFINSLQPPANPYPFDRLADAGKRVFDREGCAQCHTSPLYSNNKLTPATGFTVPAEHRTRYDILNVNVGTDPALAMQTRRGTGYYKVPSLRGVWYREYFGHGGASKTLEDWFDPGRTLTVKGHEFGLKLSPSERKALIAFLKTL